MLLTDLVGLILATAPVIGLLMWERRIEFRAAQTGTGMAAGALNGAAIVAMAPADATEWNPADVRSAALDDAGIGVALHAVLNRGGYDVVITCGGGS